MEANERREYPHLWLNPPLFTVKVNMRAVREELRRLNPFKRKREYDFGAENGFVMQAVSQPSSKPELQ
ncbi:MAG: hypothetical protein UX10_C0014G0006 [Candidatus Magasanikbacteria bacterium GW2011_GWA2_45_39]|uniref:Uncharacterized protein n=2 Tax=Candidatus Magasanikiibacteriota TaxID=1752731 RepID=A0A0G1QX09_9BACT|nr:MAG: hypothetical protein UX10_C0014G0006 [Candidatus Magasanikbacteria bacterium GW2011_GWA2_45_39]KKU13185.1 MAG: hypothetical protein UX20_C0029G0010 [Candidatus Magasanikbacteria bacterium GW2011_GWC2_45_8]HBW74040.1 hypothetical protein [Candidatus Magasanikbacteria bacterium]